MNAKDKALRALKRHKEIHDGDKGTYGFNGTQADSAQEAQKAPDTLLVSTDINAYRRAGNVTQSQSEATDGFKSFMGPKGTDGACGADGMAGIAGEMGAKGSDGASGAAGRDGMAGIAGEMGLTGRRGASVLSGSRKPDNKDGFDGDFWYDVPENMMYGPKFRNVWPKGVSLVGAQGAEGQQGLIGDSGSEILPTNNTWTGTNDFTGGLDINGVDIEAEQNTQDAAIALNTAKVTYDDAAIVAANAVHAALVPEHIDWALTGAEVVHADRYTDTGDTTDHTALTNIGTQTHAQIDTYLDLLSTEQTVQNNAIALNTAKISYDDTEAAANTASIVTLDADAITQDAAIALNTAKVTHVDLLPLGNTWAAVNTFTLSATFSAGLTATTGGLTATAGDIVATAGDFTATVGDFVATAGNGIFYGPQGETTNLAFGTNALFSATGGQNVGIGSNAGLSVTTGTSNLAIGASSLLLCTTGIGNVAVGQGALLYGTGTDNVGIGRVAGQSLGAASNSTVIGSGMVATATSNMVLIGAGSTERLKITSNKLKLNTKTVIGAHGPVVKTISTTAVNALTGMLDGELVYDTTTNKLKIYDVSTWVTL